jgi:hypothetical protein
MRQAGWLAGGRRIYFKKYEQNRLTFAKYPVAAQVDLGYMHSSLQHTRIQARIALGGDVHFTFLL